ncbi:MAG TPA: GntR family transcriptional regulator [Candidatus Hydrogenedentes bacterium]|nr:GntR family transcriptional regulator [Candidatus Hydrogenedentota bacterium]HNT86667.1 GntR family transcriptional regulator [Candidatus Hydrogenedentota bacterium]
MANRPEQTYYVNFDSAVAVYVQIENQVQFAVASGKLKPGEALPTIHNMAAMLGLNANTIVKAYRDLEVLGVVQTRRGAGVLIADKAPAACRDRIRAAMRAHLKEAVAECIACGVAEAEIRKIVGKTVQTAPNPYEAKA